MSTMIHRLVAESRDDLNPMTVCRVRSGWVILAPTQVLAGYSLLLPDPVVDDLNSLSQHDRALFLTDMAFVGDALSEVTDAFRINYEILGNSEPALHAHIFPRFRHEPDELQSGPVWFYDWGQASPFEEKRDKELMAALRRRLHSKGIVP